MKKFLLVLTGLLFQSSLFASQDCFIAKHQSGPIIQKQGACTTRHSPCSTFKIAISLMGYDSGFLVDETHPDLPFRDGYVDWLEVWKHPHNPRSWMKNSCVWYSQRVTEYLGASRFQQYVQKLKYGNQDVSGDGGQNNGLTHAWLSSSLQISPEEQISFLEKLLTNRLPVNTRAHQYTRDILFIETLSDDWKLFGKTGNGYRQLDDGKLDKTLQIGWFTGWIEKDGQAISFVQFIEDDKPENTYASLRAKAMAIDKITKMISDPPTR